MAVQLKGGCQAVPCFANGSACYVVLQSAPPPLLSLPHLQMALPKTGKLTPKRFINNIHEICRSNLQNIVLPEVGGEGG